MSTLRIDSSVKAHPEISERAWICAEIIQNWAEKEAVKCEVSDLVLHQAKLIQNTINAAKNDASPKPVLVLRSDWEEIKDFVEGFMDGARDGSQTSKNACHIRGLMFNSEKMS